MLSRQAGSLLTDIPEELATQLDAWPLNTRLPEHLVTALWLVLQASTRALEASLGATPGGSGSRNGRGTGEAAPVKLVSARFADIELVARTAVADPARADDGAGAGAYFLHANHLALDCGLDFIAAQKPDMLEIGGFLLMLAQKDVRLVVDLTAASEREADASYAPAKGRSLRVATADVEVACDARKRLPAIRSSIKRLVVRRGCLVTDAKTSSHVFRRLHFASWPDHGVIASTTLRALANQVEHLHANSAAPIVVHCMAGVGRTGTLISFIAARKRLRSQLDTRSVRLVAGTLMETIAQGRRDRGHGFVQTREQFALVLTTLLETHAVDATRRRAAGEAGPVVTAAGWLACMPAALTETLRQTGRRLLAWLDGLRLGRGSAAHSAVEEDAGAATIREAPIHQAAQTTPDAIAPATAPASTPAETSATTPPPIMRPAANPAAPARLPVASRMSGDGGMPGTVEDKALSYCHEQAMARLGKVRSSGEIDAFLAEIVAEARLLRDPGFNCTDAQHEMLKAAVLKRFQRRDKGIIFQAHLARASNGEIDSASGNKSAPGRTPVAPPVFQEE